MEYIHIHIMLGNHGITVRFPVPDDPEQAAHAKRFYANWEKSFNTDPINNLIDPEKILDYIDHCLKRIEENNSFTEEIINSDRADVGKILSWFTDMVATSLAETTKFVRPELLARYKSFASQTLANARNCETLDDVGRFEQRFACDLRSAFSEATAD